MGLFNKKKEDAIAPSRLADIMRGKALPTAKELKQIKKLQKKVNEDFKKTPSTPIEDGPRFTNPFETKPD